MAQSLDVGVVDVWNDDFVIQVESVFKDVLEQFAVGGQQCFVHGQGPAFGLCDEGDVGEDLIVLELSKHFEIFLMLALVLEVKHPQLQVENMGGKILFNPFIIK